MENAFNSICRTAMTEVQSAEGVQQGDPPGPLLFALMINHLVHSASSEVSIWYLYDDCIGGEIVWNEEFVKFLRYLYAL
ncbi:hypothetical protein ACOME3_005185 [Neoechinorhynchus agilis]